MSGIISSMNALSARWADVMWPVVWQGAALALVVLGLTLALRRAPAAVRLIGSDDQPCRFSSSVQL